MNFGLYWKFRTDLRILFIFKKIMLHISFQYEVMYFFIAFLLFFDRFLILLIILIDTINLIYYLLL